MLPRPTADFILDRWEITKGCPDSYIVGLDLGKSQDFTAICVIERMAAERIHMQQTRFQSTPSIVARKSVGRYLVRNVHRYPRGTSYPAIIESVRSVMEQLPAMDRPAELVADATGVGAAVIDMARQSGLNPVSIVITGGYNTNRHGSHSFTVPKAALVSTMDALLADNRLGITNDAGASQILRDELQGFRAKRSNSGHNQFEAEGRIGLHDDVVLAAAIGLWRGEARPAPTAWGRVNLLGGR